MDAGTGAQVARRRRQIDRVDGVLQEGLDTGHEDPRSPAPPGSQGRHTGRRLIGDQFAALVGQGRPRLQDGDRIR